MSFDNKLIYGKNPLERIVNIEVIDDKAEIFIQNKEGDVEVCFAPNAYWILSNEAHDAKWKRLEGNLHYKYGKKYLKHHSYFVDKRELKEAQADIFTMGDTKESFMVERGYTYFKGLQPKDISILSFDIETTGLEHNDESHVLIISNTFRKNGITSRRLFTYDQYENEGAMLLDWCNWVRDVDPSIILGHNIFAFDLPYMEFVAEKYGTELYLGRNGSPIKFATFDSQKRVDGSRSQSYNKVSVYGRDLVDTMFLAINYDIGKKYESYALKKIIAQEKLEVVDRQFYDASKIREMFLIPEEWEKIKQYALHDADDSLALFDLMAPAFFYLTQSVPKTFQAVVETASGSQINSMMIRSYLQEGHSLPKASDTVDFEGAISIGNPGIYKNVFKVDVASLYPSIMIEHKVHDKDKDPKANMFEMVKTFTSERLKNKKLAKETGNKYYDDMQNAQKIIINSMYGFMGATGLLFNSPENAAFVTRAGRDVLTKAIDWSNTMGFKLVNADTDSISICAANSRPLDMEDRIYWLLKLNALFSEQIRFEDDGYFLTVIVLAAKNYILWDGKKIKTKGSSLKDAKSEKGLREFLDTVIKSMIEDTNHYSDIYHRYVKEILDIKDISRWSSKKTISSKVLSSPRANESKIRDAIVGSDYREGDKVFCYFKSDKSLGLAEKFDGDYDKNAMLKKLFKKSLTFQTVIDKSTFPDYSLKKNKKILEEVINGTSN